MYNHYKKKYNPFVNKRFLCLSRFRQCFDCEKLLFTDPWSLI